MPWYSWTFFGLGALYLLVALYAVGLLSWERFQERRISKAVKRADGRWAAEHGIDLAHTAYPRFLPGERLP